MTKRARGSFEVKISPLPPDPVDPGFGKLVFDKTFRGDVEGTSKGLMFGVGDPKDGEAGYVALERFTGTVQGRRGSFVFQHSSWMSGGAMEMDIKIAPGSGTEELAGISGRMTIHISGSDHSYDFDYQLR